MSHQLPLVHRDYKREQVAKRIGDLTDLSSLGFQRRRLEEEREDRLATVPGAPGQQQASLIKFILPPPPQAITFITAAALKFADHHPTLTSLLQRFFSANAAYGSTLYSTHVHCMSVVREQE